MKEKELRAVWRIEKNGRGGLLAGTAHFFPYRLGKSLEAFIRPARTVLFEGPLDEASMNQVVAKASEGEGAGALYEVLDPAVRREIKKFLGLPGEGSGSLPLLLSIVSRDPDPLREHFRALRPWMAFFEIWAHFLKSKGWRSSVDLEAQQIAARLGKEIRFLETIEEQVAALEGHPAGAVRPLPAKDRALGRVRPVPRPVVPERRPGSDDGEWERIPFALPLHRRE